MILEGGRPGEGIFPLKEGVVSACDFRPETHPPAPASLPNLLGRPHETEEKQPVKAPVAMGSPP